MPGQHRFVYDTDEGAIVLIHVQPNASSTAYAGEFGEALKIRIAGTPVDGAANRRTHPLSGRPIQHSSTERAHHKRNDRATETGSPSKHIRRPCVIKSSDYKAARVTLNETLPPVLPAVRSHQGCPMRLRRAHGCRLLGTGPCALPESSFQNGRRRLGEGGY